MSECEMYNVEKNGNNMDVSVHIKKPSPPKELRVEAKSLPAKQFISSPDKTIDIEQTGSNIFVSANNNFFCSKLWGVNKSNR